MSGLGSPGSSHKSGCETESTLAYVIGVKIGASAESLDGAGLALRLDTESRIKKVACFGCHLPFFLYGESKRGNGAE